MPRNGKAAEPPRGSKQSIAFGLVNVPIKIKSLDASEKDTRVGANYICPQHKIKVRQQYVCDHGGTEHVADKIKGYPVDGQYVVIDDDVIDAIVAEKTKSIVIDRFVPDGDIDPIYYKSVYLLWPDSELGGAPYYDLLAAAMRDAGMAAVGNAVIAGGKSTSLVVIRWSPPAAKGTGTLVAHTLKYDAAIRWAEVDLVSDAAAQRPAPAAPNLKMAGQIIQGLANDFDPTAVEDEFTKQLKDLIAQAAAGRKLAAPKTAPAPVQTGGDLMAELERTISDLKAGGKAKKPAARKKAVA